MTAWPVERTELFMKLWAEGLSASQIAAAINAAQGCNITKNAVIGKMDRAPSKPKGRNASKGACERFVKASGKVDTKKPGKPDRVIKLPDSKESTMHVVNSVLALRDNQCRYLIGDLQDVDSAFCKGTKIPGKSYCAEHANILYTKWKPKPPGSRPADYSPKKGSCKSKM